MDSDDSALALTAQDPDSAESAFFDLHPPASTASHVKIEDLVQRLLSEEHLHFILGDHGLFYKFSTFLNRFKPNLIPTLVRYLEMRKAMKAVCISGSSSSILGCRLYHSRSFYHIENLISGSIDRIRKLGGKDYQVAFSY